MKRQHIALKAEALKQLADKAGVDDWKNSKNIAGTRCASWMDGSFLQGLYTATRQLNDERPDVNCAGAGGLSALRDENGRSINIGMCDGSVRPILTTVKLEVWKALSTRNGGEVVDLSSAFE